MGFAVAEGVGRCTDPGWPGAAWTWLLEPVGFVECQGCWWFMRHSRGCDALTTGTQTVPFGNYYSSTVVCLRHFKHPGSVLPPRLYNTTLRACEESHQQAAAVALCSSLDEKSLRADEVTYSTAIACVEWQQAFLFLQDMHRTLGFYSRGGMLVVGLLFCHSSPQNGGSRSEFEQSNKSRDVWEWEAGTSLAPEGVGALTVWTKKQM